MADRGGSTRFSIPQAQFSHNQPGEHNLLNKFTKEVADMRQTQKRWARIAVTGRLRVPLAAAALPVAVLLAAAAGCSSSGPAAQTGGHAQPTNHDPLPGLRARAPGTQTHATAVDIGSPTTPRNAH